MRKDENRLKRRQKRLRWRRNRARREAVALRIMPVGGRPVKIVDARVVVSPENHLAFMEGISKREARIRLQDKLRERLGYGTR